MKLRKYLIGLLRSKDRANIREFLQITRRIAYLVLIILAIFKLVNWYFLTIYTDYNIVITLFYDSIYKLMRQLAFTPKEWARGYFYYFGTDPKLTIIFGDVVEDVFKKYERRLRNNDYDGAFMHFETMMDLIAWRKWPLLSWHKLRKRHSVLFTRTAWYSPYKDRPSLVWTRWRFKFYFSVQRVFSFPLRILNLIFNINLNLNMHVYLGFWSPILFYLLLAVIIYIVVSLILETMVFDDLEERKAILDDMWRKKLKKKYKF